MRSLIQYIYESKSFKCYIMIGLPGSGKSTWIKNNLPKNIEIVSKDLIRQDLGIIKDQDVKAIGNQEQEKEVKNIYHNKLEELLEQGKDFVIDNTNSFLSANTICFNDAYCTVSISLHNKLIRIEREDHYCLLYSIDGNLHTEFYLEKDKKYIVFDVPNNGFFPYELDKTKGVVSLPDEIIIPPIYKEINILDDEKGIFELTFLNRANGKSHEAKGIYSLEKGFIIPLGSEYSFPLYHNEMFSLLIDAVKDFVIYKQGEKKGIMFRGERVLDAEEFS